MKKEAVLVPKINIDLRKEIINEALDRKIKKVIIFYDKQEKVHYPHYLLESEVEKTIVDNASFVDAHVETIDIEQAVKIYAANNDEGIDYGKAWFKVEFPDPDEESTRLREAFVPS